MAKPVHLLGKKKEKKMVRFLLLLWKRLCAEMREKDEPHCRF